ADVPRILTDSDSHIHYNLHGSVYWFIKDQNRYLLPASEFFLGPYPHILYNSEGAVRQMDRGKNILITNIITGYQKTARTSVTPFKQMAAAFDRDCFFADDIYIVGYSFGDEHVNESIKNILIYNRDSRIIIIDPGFNKIRSKVIFELFTHARYEINDWDKKGDYSTTLNGKLWILEKP